MLIWFLGSTIFTISLYWFIGLIYVMLDVSQKFRKYKVQPGTNEPIGMNRLISVC